MIVTEGLAATSNIDNRQAFTIKASAKAFKLLSSNLYSDKPLAIVREIGCNALDSHFMAGKADVPFRVVLPSDMHPWFEIIDFGTGLSDEQVKSIFTTYFESTKTTSNDQIGAMGLGSKSPFAYTDAFEVFARQGGIQNQYTCFLNQSGAPEIFLIETLKDDEVKGIKFEDGVTIKVPVKKNDYHLFVAAAKKAYKFFPVKPIVSGAGKWEWQEPDYGFVGTNFKTMKHDKTIYALMGPVAYPLDLNQLRSVTVPADPFDPNSEEQVIGVDPFIASYMNQASSGFVIQYKIGELDVNAGREGLSYDKLTIINLIKGMTHIREEMAVDLQAGLDKCKNYYDAIRYTQTNDRSNIFKLKFDGKAAIGPVIQYKFTNVLGEMEFLVRRRSHWIEKLSAVKADNVQITPAHDSHFILVDDRKLYLKKIRFASASERVDKATFLLNVDTVEASKEIYADVIKKFDADGTPWKYLSDIKYEFPERLKKEVDPNQAKRAKVTYSGFYHFKSGFTSAIAVRDYVNLNDGELEDDRLYIRWSTVEKRLTFNGVKFRADQMSGYIWDAITKIAADQKKPIAIVTDKVVDNIPDNWVDVSDLLKKALKLSMTKKTFTELYGNWVGTAIDLKQDAYDKAVGNPKVLPVIKEYFDHIRQIKFGLQLDYSTEEFIRLAFAIQEDATTVDGIMNFATSFTGQHLVATIAKRYWSNWAERDFAESLVMFSAMIVHGIIDENKLKEYLAAK